MIPKIIHYCWFGKKDKPTIVKKCIDSWHIYLPDYKIIEWNEENFDFNNNKYAKEAYKEGKFAFVSDVVRIEVLYKYGGIYMDTDVEVFKSFNDLLDSDNCIIGFEEKNYIATSFIATIPKHQLIGEFLSVYRNISFYDENGNINETTNVKKLTEILISKGLKRDGKFQILENNITIYPQEYFSPYDYINFVLNITNNTYCIHHFYVSWMNKTIKFKKILKKSILQIIGYRIWDKLRVCIKGEKNA
ncbi:glycosyl transferase [Clostridium perfringens]|uniref:glycosyltransferase family 32 protein n=1 Tax=Clostridium perfringens TaxID=1502 RepID=UPI001A2166CC|nr:glycosyltransferase [Clostridium perfringens]UBK71822.1 glycosyl transferase [Clostridium perfringens]HAT4134360.1 glycosyl transferase [Clostridium perfringens]HAT4149655.1 glycosyl transferase [Clostridium perfringens]